MKKEETDDFQPFIPADKIVPEFTVTSIVLGVLLAVVFGAANAYLGLRVGMTISASIPAAVISMGIIRMVLRKDSILENNMVQTIGSAGESIAAGAIFTLPAMFIWMQEWGEGTPSLLEITLIALVGGILGILFMIPLRKALIVEEHAVLPYPEGTACAEVLLAGEEGGSKASAGFTGLGAAAGYKLISDGFKLFPSSLNYDITAYKGSAVGIDLLPALVGVGYICGPRISSYMLAGGVMSWLVMMPMLSMFGGDQIFFPATDPVSALSPSGLWSNYIRYIGAGAVAAGGIISLVKSFPLIIKTFGKAMKGLFRKDGQADAGLRTGQDISMKIIVPAVIAIILLIWALPVFPVPLAGAFIIAVFGFFFATVSARLVGLVGSSNNPVSGMTIATLLFSTLLLKLTGMTGHTGMLGAIAIGSIICMVASIAGDTSQDLKTGYLLGATPRKQQYGEIIGVVAASLAIGGVLYLLNAAWGYGSQELPAPQAMLMKMVVEGVMEATLPWTLVLIGVGLAIVAEIVRIPVLPFAVGLYLPIHLSTGIMAGGLVRLFFEKRKKVSEEKRKEEINRGILYTSGLIAGEGLIGILLAVFAVIPIGTRRLSDIIDFSGVFAFDSGDALQVILAIVIYGLLIFSLFQSSFYRKNRKERSS